MSSLRDGVSFLRLLHQQPSRACVCRCAVLEIPIGRANLLFKRMLRTTVHGMPIPAHPARDTSVILGEQEKCLAHLPVGRVKNAQREQVLYLCRNVECFYSVISGPNARRSGYFRSAVSVQPKQERVLLRFKTDRWSGTVVPKRFFESIGEEYDVFPACP